MGKATLLGLGPVGLTTAWGLLKKNHVIHGYDANIALVDQLKMGNFPRAEEIAGDLRQFSQANFFLHKNFAELPLEKTIILCVGTPFKETGFDLEGLKSALQKTRAALGSKQKRHFILRSTLAPGTIQQILLPILGEGEPFEFSYYPEFLREKFLKEDHTNPPLRVAAHSSSAAKEKFLEFFPDVKEEVPDFASAEMLKMACNAFHALKVVFANEVSDICEKFGASPDLVMKFFCDDKKLNISPKYLKPGAPFAGPCLGKDLSALEALMDQKNMDGHMLRSIQKSNNQRMDKWRQEK